MNIIGYAIVKNGAEPLVSTGPISEFTRTRVRIMEFAVDNKTALVVSASGDAIAEFKLEDFSHYFRCELVGDIPCAPGLTELEKWAYAAKVMSRKGGWAPILKEMVIAASLHRREFCDSVLWSKQDDPAPPPKQTTEVSNP